MPDPDRATALASLAALAASREPVTYGAAMPVFCALVGVLFGPSTQTARVLCHLADAMCVATDPAAGLAHLCDSVAPAFLVTEQGQPLNELAALLRRPAPDSAALDAARIRREVRRVRALAEGRMIREVRWRVGDGRIEYSEDVARSLLSSFEGPLVRVTRTRRL